jgi:hypothetical protein
MRKVWQEDFGQGADQATAVTQANRHSRHVIIQAKLTWVVEGGLHELWRSTKSFFYS